MKSTQVVYCRVFNEQLKTYHTFDYNNLFIKKKTDHLAHNNVIDFMVI